MSALCTVLIVSKEGKSPISNQMQVAAPLMVAFENCAVEQFAEYVQDAGIHAVIFDGARLNKQHLKTLHALIEGDWRLELNAYWWHKASAPNPFGPRVYGTDSETYSMASLLALVCQNLQHKASTPFFSALKNYVNTQPDSWHTPGHSGGYSLRYSAWGSDFYHFVGQNIWQADLSVSVQSLDSLLHPEGVIADAQRLAAEAFGAKTTYFATNGSSTANKVILQSVLVPGDTLLLDRNCHKSVHHGVILSGARPVYLNSSVNEALGIFASVPLATILATIEAQPHAKAIILTSSTYDGLCYDLKPVIEAAHKHGMKVIIDEAWYGFARFHPRFRPTALELGADYVTQSTHKTMSAFSQASMVHVNDPEHNPHILRETFNMHASTSPQYSIIASLDVARQQMVMEGYGLLEKALSLAETLRQKINETRLFSVLTLAELLPEALKHDQIRLDPTKITIDVRASGLSGDQVQQLLFERFNIQVEKSTFATITAIVTIGATANKMMRLVHALTTLSAEAPKRRLNVKKPLLKVPSFTKLAGLPRDAFYFAGDYIPLIKAGKPNKTLIGKVCCDQIVPYPPGIPVLVPAQVIDEAVLKFLTNLILADAPHEIHGLVHRPNGYAIRVLSKKEQAKLVPLE
ncbi:aminotransferase class I/II-fold pyridoxal phosphate-dependent enzyme [Neisseriaceae bacterium CLB008]